MPNYIFDTRIYEIKWNSFFLKKCDEVNERSIAAMGLLAELESLIKNLKTSKMICRLLQAMQTIQIWNK